ncbi:MAG: DUF4350 domain-containing protein [Pseudomonadales bacterium]
MSERLHTAALLLLTLLALLALFVRPSAKEDYSRPTSHDTGPDGMAALSGWLREAGIAAVSWQERFPVLADRSDIPRSGNVLYVVLPSRLGWSSEEVSRLYQWLASGNTLVLAAALNETPRWSQQPGHRVDTISQDIERLTGASVYAVPARKAGEEPPHVDGQAEPLTLFPFENAGLMEGVSALHHYTDLQTRFWMPDEGEDNQVTVFMAREEQSLTPAIWELTAGSGRIIVLTSTTLLANRGIGQADNRQLARNLVRFHLQPGAVWLFDDMHQGLSALYDPEAFFKDPRLWYSVAFLLIAWFVYMLGTNGRLAPPRDEPLVFSQADHVRAMSGFMARKLAPLETGRLLLEQWARESGSAPHQGVRELVLRLRTLPPSLQKRLLDAEASLASGRAVNLNRLNNDLHEARKRTG